MSVEVEAIEETNAAIGAAISTGGCPSEVDTVLEAVQRELLNLADAVDDGTPWPSTDTVRQLAAEIAPDVPPGFAVLGGYSAAAGLLKLARAIARRASRTVVAGQAREYLDLLADALLSLAFRAEEHERTQVPVGLCGEVA